MTDQLRTTIDYLDWYTRMDGSVKPSLQTFSEPCSNPVDFAETAMQLATTGFWVTPNVFIPPAAIFRVRRTNQMGYTVNSKGVRIP